MFYPSLCGAAPFDIQEPLKGMLSFGGGARDGVREKSSTTGVVIVVLDVSNSERLESVFQPMSEACLPAQQGPSLRP